MRTHIARFFKRGILLTAILLLICEAVPVTAQSRDHVQLFQDGDEMFGTGDTYFAVSSGGTLVGWGSNHLNRIGGLLPWRPYFARKTVAKAVTSVSCGSDTVMYVDSDSVLWGWGNNKYLLFSDGMLTPMGKKQVMRDVCEIAVGYECAAAVKTDGSLWTWGRNSNGQLGVGKGTLNEGEYCSPQKVLDHVKAVKIIDGIPFAITMDDTLCTWGMDRLCEPTMVAEQVKDVACLGGNLLCQYLTLDGNVFAFDVSDVDAQFAVREHRQIAENVRSICDRGMVKHDSTLWSWVCEGEIITPLKEKDGVWTALDRTHYLTDGGRFYLQATWLPVLRSTRTAAPVLRNLFFLLVIGYMALRRKPSAA